MQVRMIRGTRFFPSLSFICNNDEESDDCLRKDAPPHASHGREAAKVEMLPESA